MNVAAVSKWLNAKGYTQKIVADQIGIHPRTISAVICGRSKSKRVERWLLEQGCPAEYLAPEKQKRIRTAKSERIKRFCLKCDRPFVASGRFNRICETCSDVNRTISHQSYTVHQPRRAAPGA